MAAGDRENNHDWNIVTILGERYLVDVTWDSGHIDERNQGVKEYSTEYLFQAPVQFIYRHFPEYPADQLLDPPLSMDEFFDLPTIRGSFFDLGLGLRPGELRAVMRGEGRMELSFSCPASVVLDAGLRDERGLAFERTCMVAREGDVARVLVVFPALVNGGPACEQPAFPLFYAPYYDKGCRLREPLQGILEKRRECLFSIEVPGASRVGYLDGGAIRDLEPRGEGLFSGTVRVPGGGPFKLLIPATGTSWSSLCEFMVR